MRISQEDYFMVLAGVVALRSTCDRARVGCILVKDKSIVSTGYNGSVSGAPHCDDHGHIMLNGHCIATVHAESNAIAQAAKHGHSTDGCIAYCTHKPCSSCMKLLINSGITVVHYMNEYDDGVQQHWSKYLMLLKHKEKEVELYVRDISDV